MLNAIIDNTSDKLTLDQIAEAYKKTLNPSLLASAFHKTYKLIIKISHNYYGLSEDDVASYSLEKLDLCLQTYDSTQSTFSTYFTRTLINKFREETEALNTQKRKAIFYSDSYEAMVENGFDLPIDEENRETLDSLKDFCLTEREYSYCELTVKEYSNAEIAAILGVSVMTLTNIRKKLRKKLVGIAL